MKTPFPRYDIIGDIHGHADALQALLAKLGYVERGGVYRHPKRTAIFVGDFIDRGPKIQETLEIVRAMVDAGAALAVMGNHEYNAISFHTPNGRGAYLRPRDEDKVHQHQATLDQIVVPQPERWVEWLKWFKSLPLFLDLGSLRIVHACWDAEQIALLHGDNRLTDDLLFKSGVKGTPEFRTIEVLLKGKEIDLPLGRTFPSRDGVARPGIRVKWWLRAAGRTYHDLALPTDDAVPRLLVPSHPSLQAGYDAAEPPVFIGHYWLKPGKPEPLSPNVGCVDYSVAKEGGILVAYRFDGESELNRGKFVHVGQPPLPSMMSSLRGDLREAQ